MALQMTKLRVRWNNLVIYLLAVCVGYGAIIFGSVLLGIVAVILSMIALFVDWEFETNRS